MKVTELPREETYSERPTDSFDIRTCDDFLSKGAGTIIMYRCPSRCSQCSISGGNVCPVCGATLGNGTSGTCYCGSQYTKCDKGVWAIGLPLYYDSEEDVI